MPPPLTLTPPLRRKERQEAVTAPAPSQRKPTPNFDALGYDEKRLALRSPFASSLSTQTTGPALMFPTGPRPIGITGEQKVDENEETNDPPEFSSLGVQTLSERRSEWGRSFRRAGGLKSNLSVEEEQANLEPTATTYHPSYESVNPRAPSHPLYDRLDGDKWSDKFAAMTGPGSYDEGGSVGKQGTRFLARRIDLDS